MRKSNSSKAFTLVEVMIAVMILGFVAATFTFAVLFTIKQNHQTRIRQIALDAARFYEGQIQGSLFNRIGEPTATGFEASFNANQTYFPDPTFDGTDGNSDGLTDTPLTSAQAAALAGAGMRVNPAITASFRFAGWGTVNSATATSFSPVNTAVGLPYVDDEFVGSFVQFSNGTGAGQIALITDNDASSFTMTADLSGDTSEDLAVIPGAGTTFRVNGGKTCDITITWTDGRFDSSGVMIPRSVTRRVLKTP